MENKSAKILILFVVILLVIVVIYFAFNNNDKENIGDTNNYTQEQIIDNK